MNSAIPTKPLTKTSEQTNIPSTKTEADLVVDFAPLVKSICRKFADRHSLDYDELLLEAQLPLLQAIRSHDSSKGTLSEWIRMLVSQRIMQQLRHPGSRNRCHTHEHLSIFHDKGNLDKSEHTSSLYSKEMSHDPPDRSFDIGMFLADLSDDAAKAVHVVLTEGVADRLYIESVLHSSLKWTETKIARVCKEIEEALS